jgi:hypothetical protein
MQVKPVVVGGGEGGYGTPSLSGMTSDGDGHPALSICLIA